MHSPGDPGFNFERIYCDWAEIWLHVSLGKCRGEKKVPEYKNFTYFATEMSVHALAPRKVQNACWQCLYLEIYFMATSMLFVVNKAAKNYVAKIQMDFWGSINQLCFE